MNHPVFSRPHSSVLCRSVSVAALAIGGGLSFSTTALADCAPAGNNTSQLITCDAPGSVGNFGAGNGDDTINIISGLFDGDIRGGRGNDSIVISGGTVENDIHGGNNNNNQGGANDDTIRMTGGVVNDDIEAGNGDDLIVISGGFVDDGTRGGNGSDTIIVSGGDLGTLEGEDGNDVIQMSGGTVFESDIFEFDSIQGGDGDDLIEISGGETFGIQGGADDDTIRISGGFHLFPVEGGGGRDLIEMTGGSVGEFNGGGGRDTLTMNGGSVASVLFGAGGRDSITMNNGTVGNIDGGNGDDIITLNGGSVAVAIFGGLDNGNDSITMNGGTIFFGIAGEGGDDTITVNGGLMQDDLFADNGDDRIEINGGVLGNDLHSGRGDDLIVLNGGVITGDIADNGGGGTGGNGDDTVNIGANMRIDNIGGVINMGETAEDNGGDVLNWTVGGTQTVTTGKFVNFEIINIDGTGRLEIAAGQELEADTINFAVGSRVGGSGTLTGDVNFAGTVAPGTSPGILTVNGNATFDGTANLVFGLLDLGNDGIYTRGTEYDGMDITGDLILNGDVTIDILFDAFPGTLLTGTIFDFMNFSGSFIDNGFSFVLGDVFYDQNANWQISIVGGVVQLTYIGPNVTVPAPGALALLGAGVASVAALGRRRRKMA